MHAATRVKAHQRGRLEQLCRYIARPPLAQERLKQVDKDTFSYQLKRPWSDGTTHVVLSASELLQRLAALVPPPRFNPASAALYVMPRDNRRTSIRVSRSRS